MNMLALSSLLDQQAKVSITQQKLATGKEILAPSDDPIASSSVIKLEQSLDTTEQYQRNIGVLESRLNLEDSVLESFVQNIHRTRELVLQGNNDTLTDHDRSLIALELEERLGEMVSIANTKDANGEYIFSGYQGKTMPFTKNPMAGFNYNGDAGQRFIQTSSARSVANGDSGMDVFMDIKAGNGTFTASNLTTNTGAGIIDAGSVIDSSLWIPDAYTLTFTTSNSYEVRDSGGALITGNAYTPGSSITFNGIETSINGNVQAGDKFSIAASQSQDVFTTVENIIKSFRTPATTPAGSANLHNSVNNYLVNIDQALDNVVGIRANIGARLNTIDTQRELNDSHILRLKENISNIMDVDYIETASKLNLQMISLEAAQQSYIKVTNLTLFNYL